MMDKETLTKEQKKAIGHGEGPLLIVAGAGTGKTKVLTNRIAYLIEEKEVDPSNILAVTFTNNASLEMKQRLEGMISSSFEELWTGTFHSLSAEILRVNAIDYGLSPFYRIVTSGERVLLLATEFDKFNLNYHQVRGRPYGLISTFLDKISKAKNEMISPDDLLDWTVKAKNKLKYESDLNDKKHQALEEIIGKYEELEKVYRRYDQLLMERDSFDFDDLIIHCINLLIVRPRLLDSYRSKWKYILVDEYQDTNYSQSRLVEMLAGENGNLCCVGDDDQSIYRFRGASVANFLSFTEKYKNTKEIMLESNFRSTKEILDSSYSIVKNNVHRKDKRLVSALGKEGSDSVILVEAETPKVEADYILSDILKKVEDGGDYVLNDFAILSSKNATLKPVMKALTAASIPFNSTSKNGFFENAVVKDMVAWMRVIRDPLEADSLIRTLEAEPFNIDRIDCNRINRWSKRRKVDLIDAVQMAGEVEGLSKNSLEILKSWQRSFKNLTSKRRKLAADLMLRQIIDEIGYRSHLLLDDSLESIESLLNISKLEEIAQEFSAQTYEDGISKFVDYLNLLRVSAVDDFQIRKIERDAVNLMSVHKAKGLEFRVVYLIGVTDNSFPGKQRLKAVLPIDLVKSHPQIDDSRNVDRSLSREFLSPSEVSKEAHIEESRRIFYVACTRAKEELKISYPILNDELDRPIKRSRFIEGLIADTSLEPIKISVTDVDKDEGYLKIWRELGEVSPLRTGSIGDLVKLKDNALKEALVISLRDSLNRIKLEGALSQKDMSEFIEKVNVAITDIINVAYLEIIRDKDLDEAIKDKDSEKLTKFKEIMNDIDISEFLPFNEDGGLTLSVSDIVSYNDCPFLFMAKKVYRIPPIMGVEAEFGTIMHSILQNYHSTYKKADATLSKLKNLFKKGVEARKISKTNAGRQLIKRAEEILEPYFDDFKKSSLTPSFFEREFHWLIGPHWITGRVDRVDEKEDQGYELIDYKTSKAWTPKKVREDLQLAIYGLAALESWEMEAKSLSYYFLFDNKKMTTELSDDRIKETRESVLETIEKMMEMRFDPRIDYMRCQFCDFNILCKAKE